MASTHSTQVVLIQRPEGIPSAADFEVRSTPVAPPNEGEVLVDTAFVSLDPAMRGWMRDVRSYVPPVALGAVMRAGTVGRVVASRDAKFAVGDAVGGMWGVQSRACVPGKELRPIDESVAPLPAHLGVVGMPGMTAYFGLLDVGAMKAGETVLVSGAAGAVGSVVGQVAKIKGARAVGLAGGPEKCRLLVDEFGFDAAIDYKNEDVYARIKQTCPDGVDVYFDNVGGPLLDIALSRLAMRARVVICGAISQYNAAEMTGPKNYMALLVQRARMEGFVIFDFAPRYAEAAAALGGWLAQDKLAYRETIVDGLENFTDAFARLFSGEKVGKLVLRA